MKLLKAVLISGALTLAAFPAWANHNVPHSLQTPSEGGFALAQAFRRSQAPALPDQARPAERSPGTQEIEPGTAGMSMPRMSGMMMGQNGEPCACCKDEKMDGGTPS